MSLFEVGFGIGSIGVGTGFFTLIYKIIKRYLKKRSETESKYKKLNKKRDKSVSAFISFLQAKGITILSEIIDVVKEKIGNLEKDSDILAETNKITNQANLFLESFGKSIKNIGVD